MSSPPPTPTDLRDELTALVIADLLGPKDGPNETLTDPRERVSSRYLVGMMAPRGLYSADEARIDEGGARGDDTGEGGGLDGVAARASLFPSSFGCTFAVDLAVETIDVRAAWGRYLREAREGDEGSKAYVWQRYPMSGETSVRLVDGEIDRCALNATDAPGVVVRGRARRAARAWVVSLFLVNEQAIPKTRQDEAWLFQVEMHLEGPRGAGGFLGRHLAVDGVHNEADPERRQLDMLYRHEIEFAVGHGIATHAVPDPGDPTRAIRIETRVAPDYDVAKVEAPGADEEPALATAVFDMKRLSDLDGDAVVSALTPLADAYEAWLDGQAQRPADPAARLGGFELEVERGVASARETLGRLRAGIAILAADANAATAFRFANESMWQQRVRSVALAARRNALDRSFDELLAAADTPRNRSWRPFQLAFVLINLPALVDPTHAERSQDHGLVDLLFFPTGGGKTEAYLGLTAFTLAIRRLQSVVDGYNGADGVAVLMRYTLRLLTAQQFQRAATLMCACEIIRRRLLAAGDGRWGETPFRIGMWVGSAVTPNTNVAADGALTAHHGAGGRGGADPVQVVACPWCGDGIDGKRHADLWRTLVFCADPLGRCDFTSKRSPNEGLPMVTVDEEVYRLVPSLVIATVDKFAQLPWLGQTRTLFGRVNRRCTRHGYRTADLDTYGHEEADSHTKKGVLPAAHTVTCDPMRPPDLIIQDELHLIAGPLGTMVGLYESAVDRLASWTVGGQRVRPKVIASTATIRSAPAQVRALFARDVRIFPTPVLDVGDSFFARRRSTAQAAGRRYLGICAPGVRLKSVEARVFTTLLATAQTLFETHGACADPWMTLVGYFNALRELGGARRILEDDVANRLRRTDRKGLSIRRRPNLVELTSRISSGDIKRILDDLGAKHVVDPPKGSHRPIDVLLATNMISVGVDVPRLGFMCAVGQPKATAEYIQATSRVGRDTDGPGLVVTIYNWARPRDLSHYEGFEHYHATFYRQVEALSVTPFAARALDRGLTAVLVGTVRNIVDRWNPNAAAQVVAPSDPGFTEVSVALSERAGAVGSEPGARALVEQMLTQRGDEWVREQKRKAVTRSYRRSKNAQTLPLLLEPSPGVSSIWTCPMSLREVEPTINFVLDESDDSVMNADAFVSMPPSPQAQRLPALPTNEDGIAEEISDVEPA
jgi:hypothetical protein